MTTLKVQEITVEFITEKPVRGSSGRRINVERNGQPFGQLWTFRKTRTEMHPWHAKPLNGEHRTFWNANETGGDLEAAKAWMVEQARAV